MKIGIILGTRPEIIKMSPIIRACQKRNADFFILHTGQHYSYEMDKVFFEDLALPAPKHNLEVGSGSHGAQTGKMLEKIEQVLVNEKPDLVLVEGDTNTVAAGALAASKLRIKIGHVEAGLRSYDKSMPEETNRIITDHISDFLFAPTENSRQIMLKEGIAENSIAVTGNTIADAVLQNLEIAQQKSSALSKLGLVKGKYFLVTAHRQENVDDPKKLAGIFKGLELAWQNYNLPIIYPVHPRAKARIEKFNIPVPSGIKLVEPQNYLDFLQLEANAKLILTDSGGVQEEACILKVPCITLRENTERPETVSVGANLLAGTSPEKIAFAVDQMITKKSVWHNPFGNGKAGERIVDLCLSLS